MNKSWKRGIFVGMSTIDVVYFVDRFPTPNSKVSAQGQEIYVGGPATNAAITFNHLGGQPTLVTVVGRHPLADLMRAEFRQHEIAVIDLNAHFEAFPVLSSITVNPAGERNIVSANARGMSIPKVKLEENILGNASVLLVDGHYMPAAQAWAAAARDRAMEVVLDGGSWKSGTDTLLKHVTTAICSADFAPPGCSTQGDVIHYLKSSGVQNIAITNGASPIRFVSAADAGFVPVPQVDLVDTMGAGDVFHGAFCYYFALGRSVEESLRAAAVIAAESCRYRGTREWMRHISAGDRSRGHHR